jgi:glycosyltransferase involved in cell wall biosynthesis
MKILVVTPIFVPAKSNGLKTEAHDCSRTLANRGHEVTVYTTDADGKGSRLGNIQGVKEIDGVNVRYFKNLSSLLAFKLLLYLPMGMASTIKKEIDNFDIIHLYDFRNVLNIIARHYAQKCSIPYVQMSLGSTTRIGGKLKRSIKALFDVAFGNRILADASMVMAISEVGVKEYEEAGVIKDKIALLSPAWDVNLFSRLPPFGQFREKFGIKEKYIVLFFGRITWIKGIDFLVKAFCQLIQQREDTILAIVGPDDGYKGTLEKLINDLGISRKVLFTGYLAGEDKLSALVDATVLVQTSIYEAGPGSPVEAILCGTPIIVTNNTGAGDIVAEMDAGYLVQYGNVNELTNMMQKVLEDPTEARDKAQRAKQHVAENLSWEKIIEEYEGLYESVIGEGR